MESTSRYGRWRPVLEIVVLVIGASVLAAALFYAAGFRGMVRNHRMITDTEAAAGWVANMQEDGHGSKP